MGYQKLTNVLATTPDELPRFVTKKWKEIDHQSGNIKIANQVNQ